MTRPGRNFVAALSRWGNSASRTPWRVCMGRLLLILGDLGWQFWRCRYLTGLADRVRRRS